MCYNYLSSYEDIKIEAHLYEEYCTFTGCRSRAKKAWVPKRMQWRASFAGSSENIRPAVAFMRWAITKPYSLVLSLGEFLWIVGDGYLF